MIIFWLIGLQVVGQNQSSELYCNANVEVGAERTSTYLDNLNGLKVGLVGNQSSLVNEVHLVDTLLSLNIDIVKIFSPEHGFRGKADAGEKVNSGQDSKTGLPIISLYGNNKKPSSEQMDGIDIMIFDIQDVGARFYTYISTLHYVMEACSEKGIKLIVLDRPNPNGHYVDGPVLDLKYKSFVGMHPIPVVHGLSIGEYAKMINGEKWLGEEKVCDLLVIPCEGWDHTKFYRLPIKPSPNLPNMLSIYLYPSLCFFEGTVVSIGRGTKTPFQVIGHPDYSKGTYSFTPQPAAGAKNPKLNGANCQGLRFLEQDIKTIRNYRKLRISWLIDFYRSLNIKDKYFLSNNFINLLAGTDKLKAQILKGCSVTQIRESWQDSLSKFRLKRKQYLLYKDFD